MQGLGIWELRTYIGTWEPETQIGMHYVCMYVQVSPIAGLEYHIIVHSTNSVHIRVQ